MPNNLKALLVVLFLAAAIFRLAKPLAERFVDSRDFIRRRNVWFVLTATAFLSPSFWLFVAVALPLLIWASRKDRNPVALYVLLLHVIPPLSVQIPVIGINELFPLDMYRLLSLGVLLPAALRPTGPSPTGRRVRAMDLLLLTFGAIQIALFVRPDLPSAVYMHDSFTNVLRRAVLFYLDAYLVYFVVSRACVSRRAMIDVIAMFCLICAVMAPIAVFESLRHWWLYDEMGRDWGGVMTGNYLDRGGSLRAQVSAGHPLSLGYLFAIGLGLWLYLRGHVASGRARLVTTSLLLAGLLAAYSRGPWLGALLIYLIFMIQSHGSFSGVIKAAFVVSGLGAILALSPLGDRIAEVLPFMGGTVDASNVTYRERLAERSWEMVTRNPFFGDQDAYPKLGDLRQGLGVIDFVNTYAFVAVFYGLVGLFFFIAFALVGLLNCVQRSRLVIRSDPDLSTLGATLIACTLGSLVMLATSSFMFAYEKLFYVFGGLMSAYAWIPLANAKVAATEAIAATRGRATTHGWIRSPARRSK